MVLLAIALLLAIDILADVKGGALTPHVALELGAAFLAIGAMLRVWTQALRERRGLEARVHTLTAEAERWRTDARQALAGLGAAIERQFERWQLTDAERSVALLLLKGLSLKEIAAARGTSERTARQQSLAVYKKAGLGGRAELSAFFLEDLWLPSPPEPAEK